MRLGGRGASRNFCLVWGALAHPFEKMRFPCGLHGDTMIIDTLGRREAGSPNFCLLWGAHAHPFEKIWFPCGLHGDTKNIDTMAGGGRDYMAHMIGTIPKPNPRLPMSSCYTFNWLNTNSPSTRPQTYFPRFVSEPCGMHLESLMLSRRLAGIWQFRPQKFLLLSAETQIFL